MDPEAGQRRSDLIGRAGEGVTAGLAIRVGATATASPAVLLARAGFVVAVFLLVVCVRPPAASADGFFRRVDPGNFHAYQWIEDGVATNRFMDEKAFAKTLERLAAGWTYADPPSSPAFDTSKAAEGAKIIGEMKAAGGVAGTAATLRQLKGEGLSLMDRFRSFGALRALGDVALGVTAFQVGYSIGGKIATLFGFGQGEEEVGAGSTVREATAERVMSPGDSFECPAASCFGLVAEQAEVAVVTEPLGGGTPSTLMNPYKEAETGGSCKLKYIGLPEGTFQPNGTVKSTCLGEPFVTLSGQMVLPLEVECLPEEEPEKEGECEPEKVVKGKEETPKSVEEDTEIAEACLLGEICTKMPGWWWNHDPKMKEDTDTVVGAGEDLEPGDPLSVRVPSFGAHETYVEYDEKLEALELVPENIVLPEAWVNPSYGPLEVTQVNPKPSTQLEPETVVKVRYNPETATESSPATETGTPSGGWSPPSIPSIDTGPISGIEPCGVFPFGFFCWLGEAFGQFGTTGKCPSASVPVGIGGDYEIGLCGETSETVMGYVRPFVLLAFVVGCAYLFTRGTRAVGGD